VLAGFESHQRLLCTNGHVMHWPRIRGLAASTGVRLRAINGDQHRPIGLKAREKDLLLPRSIDVDVYN